MLQLLYQKKQTCPVIDEHVVITFMTQKVTIATVAPTKNKNTIAEEGRTVISNKKGTKN